MSSGWTRPLALLRELARLPQSMRGGPGYHGPAGDHFDGARFFNPDATAGRSFGDNAAFLRQQGISPVVELDWWGQTSMRGAQLIFTPAQHWSTRGPGGKNHTQWGGLWLATPQHSVFFAGDTGYSPWFAEIRRRYGSPTAALLPIGAYEPRWFMSDQHMNPDDAVRAHRDLAPRLSVAMHFGRFRLTDEGIDEPARALEQARVAHGVPVEAFRVPVPGETIRIRAAESASVLP